MDEPDKPQIIVLVPPAEEMDRVRSRVAERLRVELPGTFPECGFHFIDDTTTEEAFSIMPLAGTAGGEETPGKLFKRQPSQAELGEVRRAIDAIMREIQGERPS